MTLELSGTVALVTGASSGLGAEFARRLAERGADLVLVARREDRLRSLAGELSRDHGTVCTVIALDLTLPDAVPSLVARLAAADIRLSTLVNNAGFGNHGTVVSIDEERLLDEVRLNVTAVVALSRAFLPELLSSGRGALVNVASTAAFQPIPRMAVYAATKAFVLSFTEALWFEAKGSGLRVLALCPGPTETEFFDVAHNEDALFGALQSAEQVVGTAMKALDRRRPPASVISGTMNTIQARSVGLAPRRFVLDLVGRMGAPGRGRRRPGPSRPADGPAQPPR